jgi:hypothetical protein
LGFHYFLQFWDTEYACQQDVSAMIGEHYGSLLASSRALVDLENELQSACMSTKLDQIGWTWNLLNNSKSVGNQKKLQLKICSKLHRFSPQILWEFFSPLSYFSHG